MEDVFAHFKLVIYLCFHAKNKRRKSIFFHINIFQLINKYVYHEKNQPPDAADFFHSGRAY